MGARKDPAVRGSRSGKTAVILVERILSGDHIKNNLWILTDQVDRVTLSKRAAAGE